MHTRVSRWLALCLMICLWLTGCQSKNNTMIPITGSKASTIPARVEQARTNVLDYISASSILENMPPADSWQLDETQPGGAYRYSSGDWTLTVLATDEPEGIQRIILHNRAARVFWCGYARPDGQVVDTSFER